MKMLIRFSLPFILATFLQTMYGMVDMIVIGKFVGSNGLSAASTGTQLMNLITLFCVGFSTAGQILIAQKTGAKDVESVRRINSTLMIAILSISLCLTFIGIFGCRTFLTWLNTPPEAFEHAVSYVTICSGGIIFTGFYNMFSAVLRGMGDSKHPLMFIGIAVFLNLVLDLVFIGLFDLSVAGGALATVIGQAVSVIVSVIFLNKHRDVYHFNFNLREFKTDKNVAKALAKLGFPLALQQSAITFSFLFVSGMVNSLGVVISATFGAGQKIRDVINIVTQGISLAGASIVGQNMGAGKIDRVQKTVTSILKITLPCCLLYGALTFFFPETFFKLFSDDPAVLTYAKLYILTMLIDFPARGMMAAFRSLINGVGATRFSMIVSFSDAFLGRVFLTYLFGNILGFGTVGYFVGYSLATYVTCIPELFFFLIGKWKKRGQVLK